MNTVSALVDVSWLREHLGEPGLRVLDGSWALPNAGRDVAAEHRAARLPGAVHFDLDRVADRTSTLPHMLPSPELFAAEVGALGVADTDHVVVYDSAGLFSAPRVWWTFRVFGHERVSVLDGGLPAWRAAGGPVVTGEEQPAPVRYVTRHRPALVRDLEAVRALVATPGSGPRLLDARGRARFRGEAPELRPGLRSGHAPGALNVPFDELLTSNGRLRPRDELRAALASAGVSPSDEIVATCGSGVTACVILLALHELGATELSLYDGSFAEWGGRDDTPVVTG